MTATKKRPKSTSRKKGANKNAATKRRRSPAAPAPKFERESGPRGWLDPILESAYSRMVPRGQEHVSIAAPTRATLASANGAVFASRLQPPETERVLAAPPPNMWIDRLAEYKRRKALSAGMLAVRATAAGVVPGPVIPGAKNWRPLGPSVVLNGQAHGRPPVGGRVVGIAVAPGGQVVYAASANGGVFRSDDAGVSWRSLMDAFDIDPTQFASTSLACGAIAIDPNDPNRIYVGTGEGDTYALFNARIINALPAYRGIGPIRSDDGGKTWMSESTAAGSPTLAGQAFFALAVHPANRENVVAATSEGLYQRVSEVNAWVWKQRRQHVHCSVVAASAGATTRFFAAEWGKGVFRSTNGNTWVAAGTGFPTTDVGRIALAVQPGDPDRVYALVANSSGALLGVFRLDGATSAWRPIADAPNVLPATGGSGQGDYDLAIAVDPLDADIIYLGGSYLVDNQYWPASVWRCKVTATGSKLRMAGTPIGKHAHADVHVLLHSPGDANALWVACDGGMFLNRDPRGSGAFKAKNDGLACLCTNYLAQHPTDPGILLCGLQDNGTARASGGSIWTNVNGGDGGYAVINWADPKQVLVFANGSVYRATDGGDANSSWTRTGFPWATMTEPIVTTPYNPAKPADAKTVVVGAGARVYVSTDFGKSWPPPQSPTLMPPTSGSVFALALASPVRLFIGTTAGEVFRADRSSSGWEVTPLHDAAAGPLGLVALVSDIAIDWADATMSSVYIALGGTGDFRHVWHFDGARWEARSGSPGSMTSLLDVEHNAITMDRAAPGNVYVGADIGVWHSSDGGRVWQPMPNGLPDAPVFDLQIHPTRRLLRATTHGRGLFEFPLD